LAKELRMDAISGRPFTGMGLFDALIEDVFGVRTMTESQHQNGTTTLTLDIPGVRREDIDIEVLDRQLTIRGKRGTREFARQYRLHPSVDESLIEAALADGVLKVSFGKRPETTPKARRIDIH
jgi:HSP20 family molecular chaperone IbpA